MNCRRYHSVVFCRTLYASTATFVLNMLWNLQPVEADEDTSDVVVSQVVIKLWAFVIFPVFRKLTCLDL